MMAAMMTTLREILSCGLLHAPARQLREGSPD
jgi:hypothetical protein